MISSREQTKLRLRSLKIICLGNVQILSDPLRGRGESPKRLQKITRGGRVHQKITEDHNHREGGACKRIRQTEGANDYSKDLLSMGGSRGDIFIDQY